MGLTSASTGSNILEENIFEKTIGCNYTIGLAGNPNVGKSTVFNGLTGLHQHTGNWPGKTVSNAIGSCNFKDKDFLFVDIPGTYSLMSNSEEEEIARNYICYGNSDVIVVVVDATSLERNLNLVYQTFEITSNVIVCVNLLDEANKKGISIDLKKLSRMLGVPVVGTVARKESTLTSLMEVLYDVCTQKIIPSPNKIKYDNIIEECILLLTPEVDKLNLKNKYLNRWICLKCIDNNDIILNDIVNNLNIDLINDEGLHNAREKVKEKLLFSKIDCNEFRDRLVSKILFTAEHVSHEVCTFKNLDYNDKDRKIDKVLTSKVFGIPTMICFLGIIFWLTIVGANYPSDLLSSMFSFLQTKLHLFFNFINAPKFIEGILVDGLFRTLGWVISVMLPPMAIFFPLFTFLEDLGYLPRIAFNLDNCFNKCKASGKQALTMCMGFGCNAAGVIGCRIINSTRERLIAILTNVFVPCNGRFPFLIVISSIFIGGVGLGFKSSFVSTLIVLVTVLIGIMMTFIVSYFLSKTLLKGMPSTFTLELPPYRKPQVGQILIRSIIDRTLFVLGRAIMTAAPAGAVIWLFANIGIDGKSVLDYIALFFSPLGKMMGLDGYIITAFVLGIPANEIVLPIILMCYLRAGTMVNIDSTLEIGKILVNNGWTLITAINVMLFSLLHFPCATTLLTIKKETGSNKWTFLSFLIPTVIGIVVCTCTNIIYHLIITIF